MNAVTITNQHAFLTGFGKNPTAAPATPSTHSEFNKLKMVNSTSINFAVIEKLGDHFFFTDPANFTYLEIGKNGPYISPSHLRWFNFGRLDGQKIKVSIGMPDGEERTTSGTPGDEYRY